MSDRPVFGQPLPADPELWTACGWHPVCGHVRCIEVSAADVLTQPGLVYGRLPAEEARERLGDCPICDPGAQPELGL